MSLKCSLSKGIPQAKLSAREHEIWHRLGGIINALDETEGITTEPEALSLQRAKVNQRLMVQNTENRSQAERGTLQSCLKLLLLNGSKIKVAY